MKPTTHPDFGPSVYDRIAAKLRLVHDAIRRINDNLTPLAKPSQGQLAYIDEQAARAITWLASVRSIAITNGELTEPFFDDGEPVDLDEEIGLAEIPPSLHTWEDLG